MSNPAHTRDELDGRLTRALKNIRVGRPVPEPTPNEPTDDRLLLLIEDRLPAAERQALEQQLEGCPYSADRVDVLREALEQFDQRARLVPDMQVQPSQPAAKKLDDGESQTALQQASKLVFSLSQGVMRWLRGTDAPIALAPVMMATRGGQAAATEEAFFQFERRFGEWDAVIQIENVPSRGIDLRLELRNQGAVLDGGRAELRRRGKLLESVRVREGSASFSDLPADRYELAITRRDDTIGRVTLDVLS